MNSTELAKIAGVSRSTVSKVINNYPDVSPETREHVLSVIKEYNYVPDFAGSVLAGKKTNVIGLFLLKDSDPGKKNHEVDVRHDNSFYTPVIQTIASKSNDYDYSVLIRTITNENAVEMVRKFFAEKRIDSAIVVGVASDAAAALAQSGCPVVLFSFGKKQLEEWGVCYDRVACLEYDAYTAVKNVTQKLIKKGYRKIGMINVALAPRALYLDDKFREKKVVSDRYHAFCDTMEENSVPIESDYMVAYGYSKGDLASNLEKLIERNMLPEAFVCQDDPTAIATLKYLKSRGIRIPDDVALVGFDDSILSEYMTPSLTTVRIPFSKMATKAVERAIELAENPGCKITNDLFETELICRESADLN